MDISVDLVLRLLAQGFLIFMVLTFVIQWLLPRWKKIFYTHPQLTETQAGNDTPGMKERQKKMREQLQEKYADKVNSYRERILVPREDARRRKQDEDLERILGPVWMSKGHTVVERKSAFPSSSTSKLQVEIIQLPPEPLEDVSDVVKVRLRCPDGKTSHRRFLQTHTIQVLMDFMSNIGYSQECYTLVQTYPRLDLSSHVDTTLHQHRYQGQVLLHIEERDL